MRVAVVPVSAEAADVVTVGAAKSHPLLPEVFTQPVVHWIGVEELLAESETSRYETAIPPCGAIVHAVPPDDDTSERRAPDWPAKVRVPFTVCVVPAVNVRVRAADTLFVRL